VLNPPDRKTRRPRVLLVDDNREILELADSTLATACTIIGKVMSGRDALAAVQSLTPDVIVLDISMPGMNGFEVAEKLGAEVSPPAIVFLSVYEDEALIRAAYALGASGYVVKSRISSELALAVLAAARPVTEASG
jgi:DNA-binding NarL/FixJ family response regulator